MRVLKSLFMLAFLSCAISGQGQRLYPHSLSVGLKTSVAKVSPWDLNSAALSLDLNHQRNAGRFFSLRTALTSTYVLPVRHQPLMVVDINEPLPPGRLREYSYAHWGISFTPMFYHRDEKFSLFAGLGGGIGLQLVKNNFYRADHSGHIQEKLRENSYENFQLGWKPIIGLSFQLGCGDNEQEIEISLSREDWWTIEDGPRSDPFVWHGLQMSYKYNFMEG